MSRHTVSSSTVVTSLYPELSLLGVFLAVWTVALLAFVGLLPAAGLLDLNLYQFYAIAAAGGWLSGNVYVARARRLPKPVRRRIMLIYLLGPPGLIYLIRSLASYEVQAAAPMAAVYACGVFFIFFLVPVSLKGSAMRGGSN
jgi:hypothetical protein